LSEKRSLDWPCRFESTFLKIIELYVKKKKLEKRGNGRARLLTLHSSLCFFLKKNVRVW